MPISFRSSRKPLVERPLSRISESLCWTRGWLTRFTILAVIRLLSRWRARDFVQVACPAYTGRMRATRRHRQAAAAWGASAAAPGHLRVSPQLENAVSQTQSDRPGVAA